MSFAQQPLTNQIFWYICQLYRNVHILKFDIIDTNSV